MSGKRPVAGGAEGLFGLGGVDEGELGVGTTTGTATTLGSMGAATKYGYG
jgi:hypothetical protein